MRMNTKVLIVAKSKVTELDNLGVSIGRWFSSWPQENIAQLYTGGALDVPSCLGGIGYKLSVEDRRLGRLFYGAKRTNLGASTVISGKATEELKQRNKRIAWAVARAGSALATSGFWELVFRFRMSNALSKWIRDFRPDVVYAQTPDLTLMNVVLAVRDEFRVPVCLHVTDDYPATLYSAWPVRYFMRPIVERTFRRLLNRSAVCMAIGEAMAKEYWKRYTIKFIPIQNCDSWERFEHAVPTTPQNGEGATNIVYSGSLYLNRWRSLIDVVEAALRVKRGNDRCMVHIYCPRLEPTAARAFSAFPNVCVHDTLPDKEVPSLLKGANLLVLAESFDPSIAKHIRFSISAKAHLYMMAQRPVLVYGPAGAGVVEYARQGGWADVVDKQDEESLTSAITRLLTDRELVKRQCDRARKCALQNHNITKVRKDFTELVMRCAAHGFALPQGRHL
jgi:glycosyltransferase involved in cell wall biosynthesis